MSGSVRTAAIAVRTAAYTQIYVNASLAVCALLICVSLLSKSGILPIRIFEFLTNGFPFGWMQGKIALVVGSTLGGAALFQMYLTFQMHQLASCLDSFLRAHSAGASPYDLFVILSDLPNVQPRGTGEDLLIIRDWVLLVDRTGPQRFED